MTEIVTPLYLSFACLFLGLTLSAQPSRDKRLLPGERMVPYGVLGGVAAALACVCIALVPLAGRSFLAFSTLSLWLSFLATGLRIRSWYATVHRRFAAISFLVLGLAVALMIKQVASGTALQSRVTYQAGITLMLLGWMLLQLRHVMQQVKSAQLRVMNASLVGLMLLTSAWSWILLSGQRSQILSFSPLFSEASLAFAMRLFLVSMLALLLISANGYALERMVIMKSDATDQKERSDHLNEQLNQLLNEKNEMLQALSFAARSQNLPAIMSSLSHEINQPLGAIRLNADYLLAEDASIAYEERRLLLQQLVNGSITATQVVRDFRRFLEVNLTPHVAVDLPQLLVDLVRAFQAEFSRQQVTVSLQPVSSIRVMGDPVQLESALYGALQYMLKRSKTQPQQLQIAMVSVGRFVHMRVLGDGVALCQAAFDGAFDRTTQGSDGSFSQGLWLSRAIVEHHGGAMNFYAENGQTGISLQLPILEEKM